MKRQTINVVDWVFCKDGGQTRSLFPAFVLKTAAKFHMHICYEPC